VYFPCPTTGRARKIKPQNGRNGKTSKDWKTVVVQSLVLFLYPNGGLDPVATPRNCKTDQWIQFQIICDLAHQHNGRRAKYTRRQLFIRRPMPFMERVL